MLENLQGKSSEMFLASEKLLEEELSFFVCK
jgi:hypothetical protein